MSTFLVDSPNQLVDDIVANLIVSVRLPVSQITFTTQNLVGFLQDEQDVTLVQLIKSVREDYWLTNYDQQIVTGTYSYAIHPRTIAGAMRNVVFVDPSGFEIDCPHLDPDQIKTPSYFAFRPSWQGQGFFMQDDKMVLWPQTFNNNSYKIREKFERQPNALTLAANCAQITAVNVSANTVTFAGSPPFSAAQLVDIINNNPQFTSQGDNMLISTVVGGTVTFDSTTPITAAVLVGMWVCPAGLTCVPQIPKQAYSLLLARGMLRVAAALQNSNLFNVSSKMAEDAAAKVMAMVTPRVSGSPKKLVNKNVVGGPYSFPYYR